LRDFDAKLRLTFLTSLCTQSSPNSNYILFTNSPTFSRAFPRLDLILLLILFFSIPRVVFEISDLAVDFLKLYKLLFTLLRSEAKYSRDGMEL
jgi:hypothetical protein